MKCYAVHTLLSSSLESEWEKEMWERDRAQIWQIGLFKQSIFECSLHYSSNSLVFEHFPNKELEKS